MGLRARHRTAIGLVMGLAAVCVTAQAGAQEDRGYWRAASSNALAITGDVNIGELKVSINYEAFPLAPIRRLKPVEVSAVFDADVRAGIEGSLYRLKVPAGRYIVKKNTLCGDEETQWMATYVSGRTMQVAFFSGDDEPVFTFDAVQKSSTLCGAYTYAR
ncbi:MAG: hypothetical protein ABSD70_17560 [Terracidiphilus sp.]